MRTKLQQDIRELELKLSWPNVEHRATLEARLRSRQKQAENEPAPVAVPAATSAGERNPT